MSTINSNQQQHHQQQHLLNQQHLQQQHQQSANLLSPNAAATNQAVGSTSACGSGYSGGHQHNNPEQPRRKSSLSGNGFFIDYSCTRRRSSAAAYSKQQQQQQQQHYQFLRSQLSPVRWSRGGGEPSINLYNNNAATTTEQHHQQTYQQHAQPPVGSSHSTSPSRYLSRSSYCAGTANSTGHTIAYTNAMQRSSLFVPSAAARFEGSRKTSIFDPTGHSLAPHLLISSSGGGASGSSSSGAGNFNSPCASGLRRKSTMVTGGGSCGLIPPTVVEPMSMLSTVARSALSKNGKCKLKKELAQHVPVIGCSPTSIQASLLALEETRRCEKLLKEYKRHQKRKEKRRKKREKRWLKIEDAEYEVEQAAAAAAAGNVSHSNDQGPIESTRASASGGGLRRKSIRAIKDASAILLNQGKRRRHRGRRGSRFFGYEENYDNYNYNDDTSSLRDTFEELSSPSMSFGSSVSSVNSLPNISHEFETPTLLLHPSQYEEHEDDQLNTNPCQLDHDDLFLDDNTLVNFNETQATTAGGTNSNTTLCDGSKNAIGAKKSLYSKAMKKIASSLSSNNSKQQQQLQQQQQQELHRKPRASRALSLAGGGVGGLSYWYYYYYLRENSIDTIDDLPISSANLVSDAERRSRLHINYSLARTKILNSTFDPVSRLANKVSETMEQQCAKNNNDPYSSSPGDGSNVFFGSLSQSSEVSINLSTSSMISLSTSFGDDIEQAGGGGGGSGSADYGCSEVGGYQGEKIAQDTNRPISSCQTQTPSQCNSYSPSIGACFQAPPSAVRIEKPAGASSLRQHRSRDNSVRSLSSGSSSDEQSTTSGSSSRSAVGSFSSSSSLSQGSQESHHHHHHRQHISASVGSEDRKKSQCFSLSCSLSSSSSLASRDMPSPAACTIVGSHLNGSAYLADASETRRGGSLRNRRGASEKRRQSRREHQQSRLYSRSTLSVRVTQRDIIDLQRSSGGVGSATSQDELAMVGRAVRDTQVCMSSRLAPAVRNVNRSAVTLSSDSRIHQHQTRWIANDGGKQSDNECPQVTSHSRRKKKRRHQREDEKRKERKERVDEKELQARSASPKINCSTRLEINDMQAKFANDELVVLDSVSKNSSSSRSYKHTGYRHSTSGTSTGFTTSSGLQSNGHKYSTTRPNSQLNLTTLNLPLDSDTTNFTIDGSKRSASFANHSNILPSNDTCDTNLTRKDFSFTKSNNNDDDDEDDDFARFNRCYRSLSNRALEIKTAAEAETRGKLPIKTKSEERESGSPKRETDKQTTSKRASFLLRLPLVGGATRRFSSRDSKLRLSLKCPKRKDDSSTISAATTNNLSLLNKRNSRTTSMSWDALASAGATSSLDDNSASQKDQKLESKQAVSSVLDQRVCRLNRGQSVKVSRNRTSSSYTKSASKTLSKTPSGSFSSSNYTPVIQNQQQHDMRQEHPSSSGGISSNSMIIDKQLQCEKAHHQQSKKSDSSLEFAGTHLEHNLWDQRLLATDNQLQQQQQQQQQLQQHRHQHHAVTANPSVGYSNQDCPLGRQLEWNPNSLVHHQQQQQHSISPRSSNIDLSTIYVVPSMSSSTMQHHQEQSQYHEQQQPYDRWLLSPSSAEDGSGFQLANISNNNGDNHSSSSAASSRLCTSISLKTPCWNRYNGGGSTGNINLNDIRYSTIADSTNQLHDYSNQHPSSELQFHLEDRSFGNDIQPVNRADQGAVSSSPRQMYECQETTTSTSSTGNGTGAGGDMRLRAYSTGSSFERAPQHQRTMVVGVARTDTHTTSQADFSNYRLAVQSQQRQSGDEQILAAAGGGAAANSAVLAPSTVVRSREVISGRQHQQQQQQHHQNVLQQQQRKSEDLVPVYLPRASGGSAMVHRSSSSSIRLTTNELVEHQQQSQPRQTPAHNATATPKEFSSQIDKKEPPIEKEQVTITSEQQQQQHHDVEEDDDDDEDLELKQQQEREGEQQKHITSLLRKSSFTCMLIGSRQCGKRTIVKCFVKLLNEFRLAVEEYRKERLLSKLLDCSQRLQGLQQRQEEQEAAAEQEQLEAAAAAERRKSSFGGFLLGHHQPRGSRINSWLGNATGSSSSAVNRLLNLPALSKSQRLNSIVSSFHHHHQQAAAAAARANNPEQQQHQRRHTTFEPAVTKLASPPVARSVAVAQASRQQRQYLTVGDAHQQQQQPTNNPDANRLLLSSCNNKSDFDISYNGYAGGETKTTTTTTSSSGQLNANTVIGSSNQLQVPGMSGSGGLSAATPAAGSPVASPSSRHHSVIQLNPRRLTSTSETIIEQASSVGDLRSLAANEDEGERELRARSSSLRRSTQMLSPLALNISAAAESMRRTSSPMMRARLQSMQLSSRRRPLLSLKELNKRRIKVRFRTRRQLNERLLTQASQQVSSTNVKGAIGSREHSPSNKQRVCEDGSGNDDEEEEEGAKGRAGKDEQWPSNREFPDIFLITYAVNDRESYEYAKIAIGQLRSIRLESPTPIVLVANKIDLERAKVVKSEEAKAYARKNACKYMEISCTIGFNLDNLLVGIRTQLVLKHHVTLNSVLRAQGRPSSRSGTHPTRRESNHHGAQHAQCRSNNGTNETTSKDLQQQQQQQSEAHEPSGGSKTTTKAAQGKKKSNPHPSNGQTSSSNILVRFYKRYLMDNHEQHYDCDNFSKL